MLSLNSASSFSRWISSSILSFSSSLEKSSTKLFSCFKLQSNPAINKTITTAR